MFYILLGVFFNIFIIVIVERFASKRGKTCVSSFKYLGVIRGFTKAEIWHVKVRIITK